MSPNESPIAELPVVAPEPEPQVTTMRDQIMSFGAVVHDLSTTHRIPINAGIKLVEVALTYQINLAALEQQERNQRMPIPFPGSFDKEAGVEDEE